MRSLFAFVVTLMAGAVAIWYFIIRPKKANVPTPSTAPAGNAIIEPEFFEGIDGGANEPIVGMRNNSETSVVNHLIVGEIPSQPVVTHMGESVVPIVSPASVKIPAPSSPTQTNLGNQTLPSTVPNYVGVAGARSLTEQDVTSGNYKFGDFIDAPAQWDSANAVWVPGQRIYYTGKQGSAGTVGATQNWAGDDTGARMNIASQYGMNTIIQGEAGLAFSNYMSRLWVQKLSGEIR